MLTRCTKDPCHCVAHHWAAQVSTRPPEHERENSTPALNTDRWGSQHGSHQGGSVRAVEKYRWCSLAAAQTTSPSRWSAGEYPFCTRHLEARLRTWKLSPLPGLDAWCQPSLQNMNEDECFIYWHHTNENKEWKCRSEIKKLLKQVTELPLTSLLFHLLIYIMCKYTLVFSVFEVKKVSQGYKRGKNKLPTKSHTKTHSSCRITEFQPDLLSIFSLIPFHFLHFYPQCAWSFLLP